MGVKQLMIEFVSNNFEIIITAIVSLATGGGLFSFAKFRSIKKQAEADAMKAIQDIYERTLKSQQEYTAYTQKENEELRNTIAKLKGRIDQISKELAGIRKYKCTVSNCKERKVD